MIHSEPVDSMWLPPARHGCRWRTTDLRSVLNAIFYPLRTGCQWRLLPQEFPAWAPVYYYFPNVKDAGIWAYVQRSICEEVRKKAGRSACPSVVIMDGPVTQTSETLIDIAVIRLMLNRISQP